MDSLTILAASGIRARMESLEMLANNIANQATAGFKADREFYGLYLSPEALDAAGGRATTLPVIERQWTDFSQGTLTLTGNPLHLALSGEGYFLVQGPAGPLYTRNGSFHLSRGGVLETQQGYAVLDRDRQTVRLDPGLPVEVAADGSVRQQGQTVATLAVVEFADPAALSKHEASYFQGAETAARPAARAEIHQGKLESANFSPAEAAVRLVGVMRQFEMLQKAVQLGVEMNRRAVEEVARVGS